MINYGQSSSNEILQDKKTTNYNRKSQFGIAIGFGQSKLKDTKASWQQGTINYNDSLNSIESRNIFKFDIGAIYQLNFNNSIAIRPELTTSFEGGQLTYNRKQRTENLKVSNASFFLSMPLIIKYPSRIVKPYLGFGPSVGVILGQDKNDEPVYVPLKNFDFLGDFLTGIEWKSQLVKSIVSVEMKFSTGLLNIKSDANTLYTNTIESLKRQALTLRIAVRQ